MQKQREEALLANNKDIRIVASEHQIEKVSNSILINNLEKRLGPSIKYLTFAFNHHSVFLDSRFLVVTNRAL